MKALVTLDMDGHFGAVLIENDAKELEIFRSIALQASETQDLSRLARIEAKRLAEAGSVDEITEWMEENELAMGRSGGGKINVVEITTTIPERFVSGLLT